MISRELTSSASANVRYLRESFEDTIDSIVMQQEYLISTLDVRRYLTFSTGSTASEIYTMQYNILDHLQKICYTHSIIKLFQLYYPTLDVVLSASLDKNFTSVTKVQQIQDRESLLYQYANKSSVLSFDGENLYLFYGRQIGSSEPQFITKVTLDTEDIVERLRAYDVYSDQRAFLYHWNSGTVISSNPQLNDLGAALCQSIEPSLNSGVYYFRLEQAGVAYQAFCADIPALKVTFVQLIEDSKLNAIPSRLRFLIVLSVFLCAFVSLVYFFMMRYLVTRPVHALVDCFRHASRGELDISMGEYSTKEFLSLSQGFNDMISKLNHQINVNYQQKLLLQQAQLRQLHSQIEPHFLYNSFFMLRHTIAADEVEKAESICDYLGKYFQFITRLDCEFLPLKDEYNNTMNYIAIQKMRFTPRLTMNIQPLPAGLEALEVPALILQPIIENAIEYGMPKTNACICLSFKRSGDMLVILVDDNGRQLSDEQIEKMNLDTANLAICGSHALENIHNRLVLQYGRQYGLRFYRSGSGGLCVEIRLNGSTSRQPERR